MKQRLDDLNELLIRTARPLGFLVLGYAVVIDQFRNPAIFPAAITMIGLETVVGKKKG